MFSFKQYVLLISFLLLCIAAFVGFIRYSVGGTDQETHSSQKINENSDEKRSEEPKTRAESKQPPETILQATTRVLLQSLQIDPADRNAVREKIGKEHVRVKNQDMLKHSIQNWYNDKIAKYEEMSTYLNSVQDFLELDEGNRLEKLTNLKKLLLDDQDAVAQKRFSTLKKIYKVEEKSSESPTEEIITKLNISAQDQGMVRFHINKLFDTYEDQEHKSAQTYFQELLSIYKSSSEIPDAIQDNELWKTKTAAQKSKIEERFENILHNSESTQDATDTLLNELKEEQQTIENMNEKAHINRLLKRAKGEVFVHGPAVYTHFNVRQDQIGILRKTLESIEDSTPLKREKETNAWIEEQLKFYSPTT